jgi:outer membrane protein
MKCLLILIVLGTGLGWPGYAETVPPQTSTAGVTLAECYQKALQINETIGISAENVRIAHEQYRSEVGSVLPHIDWIKSQFYQDHSNTGGTNGATGSSLLATQPLSYFQLQQPLFAGFRDFAVVAVLKSQEEQSRQSQRLTDLDLLGDVSTAFYTAITYQDQLAILKEVRKVNQDQVDQLDHWVNIGRSRPSELLSAQTQLASLDAQIEENRRQLAANRHLLLFLTNIPASVPLRDTPFEAPPPTIDDALIRAGKRPEIISAAESMHQSDLGLRYARGGHLPVLGLMARSYTERVGFLTDVRWDATFTLDVPLYEGGSTQALVRQARSQQIVASLALNRQKRDVDRQVRTAFDDLQHAQSVLTAYQKAVDLSEKNYDMQKKEYRLGTITSLDLLAVQTNMQNIRGQWLLARANAQLDAIRLRLAMGEGL